MIFLISTEVFENIYLFNFTILFTLITVVIRKFSKVFHSLSHQIKKDITTEIPVLFLIAVHSLHTQFYGGFKVSQCPICQVLFQRKNAKATPTTK
jgi:hypothetical protein